MDFADILLDHQQRYPLWEIQDIYKLIHQWAFGSEHAVSDPDLARKRLEFEVHHMGPAPDEPLLDRDGWGQFHLRQAGTRRDLGLRTISICQAEDEKTRALQTLVCSQ